MDPAREVARWTGAERVRFGRGLARELPGDLEAPVLLVTGRGTLARSGLEDLVSHPAVARHEVVAPLPSAATLDRLAAAADAAGARTWLAIGGGSVLDAAKAAAVVASLGGDTAVARAALADGAEPLRSTTLVAAPTTAGTGSEVTRWSSLWTDSGDKWSLDAAAGLPDVALVDPALTDGMDAALTACTGLDALAHACEALWGTRRDGLSDRHATRALELLALHLCPVVEAARAGRAAPEHRDGLAAAALAAGLALARTASAVAHALSYPLTGRHGVPHGLAVGLLCKGALAFAARRDPACVGRVLEPLGLVVPSDLAGLVDRVCGAAGLAPRLSGHGLGRDVLPELIASARGSPRLANAGAPPDDAELAAVVEACL